MAMSEANADPNKVGESGGERDPSGRFLPGHKGKGGRPRGLDFRAVVMERAEAEGRDIKDAVWVVFLAMLKQASNGDVQAAKFIADRLCDNDPTAIHVTTDSGPPVPNVIELRAWARKLADLSSDGHDEA